MTPPAKKATSTTAGPREARRVGSVRPSQLIHTYGVGALVDLPNFSVIVGGLDKWDLRHMAQIPESRLLRALQSAVGQQVARLYQAPYIPSSNSLFDDWAWVGVNAYPFPGWLYCTRCRTMARVEQGVFEFETSPARTHRARFVHNCSGKKHLAQPVRVVLACADGHLDDMPWVELVHLNQPCAKPGEIHLELNDTRGGARAADQVAKCRACGEHFNVRPALRRGGVAFGCRGRHPHLRSFDSGGCDKPVVAQLVGAANAWFGTHMSALSLPVGGGELDELVESVWHLLEDAEDEGTVKILLKTQDLAPLRGYSPKDIFDAVEARRAGDDSDADDILGPEWDVLCANPLPATGEFHADVMPTPAGFAASLQAVVAVDRLREVAAMYGFSRIAALDDTDVGGNTISARAPICETNKPHWLPATETRGEGIFIRFPETTIATWEATYAARHSELEVAHRKWRSVRDLDPDTGMPPARYVLLHTLAHLLISEISVECGYNAASIRERIYSRAPGSDTNPMAGILIYTAAPDSEGTLGGLVALADPAELERLLTQAINRATLCSSDPYCSDHEPGVHDDKLHGAACASCLFVPETSCERGNRYLDRATIKDTLTTDGFAYPWTT